MLGFLNRLPWVRKIKRKRCASRIDSSDIWCENDAWWPSRYCGRHQGKFPWVWRLIIGILIALAGYSARAVKEHFFPPASKRIEAKVSDVANELAEIRRDLHPLLSLVATNPAIDLRTRSQILALEQRITAVSNNVVDLEAWKADRDMRSMSASLKAQRAKEIEEERLRVTAKPYWDNSRPIYQFAIQRLEEILRNLARQKGQTAWSRYRGIPLEPTSGEQGELGIGTNKNWHLKILTDMAPALRIRSENGLVFYLASNPQMVVVSLSGESESLLHEEGLPTKFRETVEPAIRDFVLELSERDQARQK
jgi:hypothetical protein